MHNMQQDYHLGDRVRLDIRRDDGLLYEEQGVVMYKLAQGMDDDPYYCIQLFSGKAIDCPGRVLTLVPHSEYQ